MGEVDEPLVGRGVDGPSCVQIVGCFGEVLFVGSGEARVLKRRTTGEDPIE